MRGVRDGDRRVRLRSAETKRWRTYDVDADLDPGILQRLNDLAFLYGVEIVSTCAGHDAGWDGNEDDVFAKQASFAEVRFTAFYPYGLRLEAQRAELCIEMLAAAVSDGDTVVEVEHNIVLDSHVPRNRRLGQSFLTVRYARPTSEDPSGARTWWNKLAERMMPAARPMRSK